MTEKLIDIVTKIKVGHTFREKLLADPLGDVAIVQLRDVDSNRLNIDSANVWIKDIGFKASNFLQKGDVIFAAKGSNNRASVFNTNIKAVASSVFFIIRLNPQLALPHYVAWYINSKLGQAYINSVKDSSTTINIKKKDLERLPISLPKIKIQRQIAALAELSIKEMEILEELKGKRKAINEQIIINSIIKR